MRLNILSRSRRLRTTETGRPLEMIGAHCQYHNRHSIGICYEGGLDTEGRPADTRTPEQKASLWFLLKDLKQSYPKAKIVGHRDFPHVAKACPCFNVQSEMSDLNSHL